MIRSLIQGTLNHFGLEISRVPRRGVYPQSLSAAEEAALEETIARLPQCGMDLNGWESPKVLHSYLTRQRIGFFCELLDVVEAHSLKLAQARIVDVGTCTGFLLRLIAQRYPECSLLGTDTQEMFVNLARQIAPQASIRKADLLNGDANDTYDVVFCTEVLEHILASEDSLPNLLRLCAPGGALVLTVPNGRVDRTPAGTAFSMGCYSGHVNFWSPESWNYYVKRHARGWNVTTGLVDSGHKLFAIVRAA